MTIDQQIQETDALDILLWEEIKAGAKRIEKHFQGMEETEQEKILSMYGKIQDERMKKLKALL